LSRCNPASTNPTSVGALTRYVVSGEHLYAALDGRCFARHSQPTGAVVDVDLRSRRERVLSPLPGSLLFMAVAGRYVALAYVPSPPRSTAKPTPTGRAGPLVRVLDAATGALVKQLRPPASTSALHRNIVSGLQVDRHGDVLVTVGCCAPQPGELAHYARPLGTRPRWWWAGARATVGRETHLGRDAVLSAGRVAFLSSDPSGDETIDVRDLRRGTTRTIVSFSGSISAQGLALSGNGLAWAQQSSVISVSRGGSSYSCTPVFLSPVQLASLDLGETRHTPIVVKGVPIPPQYANEPPCNVK
jgi:hypothetical protein